jgi:thiol:disulfide interchange protein
VLLWILLGGDPSVFDHALTVIQQQQPAGEAPAYTAPDKYDPKRDPEKDLAAARAEARRSQRNTLVEVGGEWCTWCHIMDDFFRDHADLADLREKNYVLMKVNMSRENANKAFLSRYPIIRGYPHLFVLDPEGKLIQSQNSSELEDGRSYNLKRFTKFLTKFSPHS